MRTRDFAENDRLDLTLCPVPTQLDYFQHTLYNLGSTYFGLSEVTRRDQYGDSLDKFVDFLYRRFLFGEIRSVILTMIPSIYKCKYIFIE